MSRVGMKRRRTEAGFVAVTSTKRPIDKQLIAINKSLVAATQTTTTLVTSTFPCTVTGLRWNISWLNGVTTGRFDWAIVIVRDGLAVSNIANSDGSSFYQPEQDVLAFGCAGALATTGTAGPVVRLWEGSTKSMRKLMGGDAIVLVMLGEQISYVDGIVQLFCKS